MNFARNPGRRFHNAMRRLPSRRKKPDAYLQALDEALDVAKKDIRSGVPRSRIGHGALLAVWRHFEPGLRKKQEAELTLLGRALTVLGKHALPLIHKQDKTLNLTLQLDDVVEKMRYREIRPDGSGYLGPARAKFDELQSRLRSSAAGKLTDKERKDLRIWRDELDFTLFWLAHVYRFELDSWTYNANHLWPCWRQTLRAEITSLARKHSLRKCRAGLKGVWRYERLDLWTTGIGGGNARTAKAMLEAALDFRAEGDKRAHALVLRKCGEEAAYSVIEDDVHYDKAPKEGVAFLERLIEHIVESKSGFALKQLTKSFDVIRRELKPRTLATWKHVRPLIGKAKRRLS